MAPANPQMLSVLATLACIMTSDCGSNRTAAAMADSVPTAVAVRAKSPPKLDGRDDDAVWQIAPKFDDFHEFQPKEDGPPRFRTTFQVAYDDQYIYVFVRAFDPHPDSLMRALTRHDIRGPSDQLKIILDPYHDRRSGFEFSVNPDGVRREYAITDDRNEDGSWDGIWSAATRVDSVGWTAEFRVPFSQLKYSRGEKHTFGFGLWRDIERFKERTSWPYYRNSKAGFVSQLGDLTGIDGIPAPHQLEVTPYAVTKSTTRQTASGYDQLQTGTLGLDLLYGITPNVTLAATVNPDFGQVEADPSVLNLGAFETFFQEKRPFFVQDAGRYSFKINCNQTNCNGEGLFYSRRIGRSPQLAGIFGDASSPTSTPIAGAAKLTGRTESGLSVGLLNAYTNRLPGVNGSTIEPGTNYAMVRAVQDFDHGQGSIGLIGTAVNRSLDARTNPFLTREAYVGGADFRRRFLGGQYELSGSLTGSHIAGTAPSIANIQRDAVHYFQRPDGELNFDPTRQSLNGDAEELIFEKLGGGIIRFQTSYQRQSAGYEPNDLGFLLRADEQNWTTWAALELFQATKYYRRLNLNFNAVNSWTTNGLQLDHGVNMNGHWNLPNNWFIHLGATYNQIGETFCDRCTRGGPAVRQSPRFSPWFGFDGDDRLRLVPHVFVNFSTGDNGTSHAAFWSPSMDFKLSSQLLGSLGFSVGDNHDNTQWYGNFGDGAGAHYAFARLDQRTVSVTARATYTMTPNLTLEFYGAPFVTSGTFSGIRELSATPGASSYDARFKPFAPPSGASTGFDFRQLRANTVLRWEYRPGSTIFAVWTHGRDGFDPTNPNRSVPEEFNDLFGLHPQNTVLLKVAYWINR